MRRTIAIAFGVTAAVLIAGCTPKFDGPIKGKQISAKKVQIKFRICQRANNSSEECGTPSARGSRGTTTYYHLLGFRVPKGSKAPRTFKSKVNRFDYERSRSYARELKDLAPTPQGTKWFGFASEAFAGDPDTRDRFRLKFKLPDGPGGVFRYRPVTGYSSTTTPGGAPRVDCGDDAFEPSEESGANASCITDPTTRRKVRRSKRIKLD